MPRSPESLSGKGLTEQSLENWVPARAHNGHEGDAQSGENWVTARAQSGHGGEEHPVAGQTVYMAYGFQEGADRRVPKGCQKVKRDAEQPGEC